MQSHTKSSGYPFSLIAADGLGCPSGLAPAFLPSRSFGLAKLSYQVNVATGNLIAEDRLISISDVGGPVEIFYIYNSLATNAVSAWKLNVEKRIKPKEATSFFSRMPFFSSAETELTLLEADGREVSYIANSDGCYYAAESEDGTPYIKRNHDSSYTWYHPKLRITEIFDTEGRIVKRIDATGNKTGYEYNDKGEMRAIILPSGSRYEFLRSGQIIELFLIDANKKETLIHTYELENGNLKTSKTRDGYEIHYRYDALSGKVSEVRQKDQSVLQFNYYSGTDTNKNKLKTIHAGDAEFAKNVNTFVYSENTSTLIDAAGVPVVFKLDANKRAQDFIQSTMYEDKKDILHYSYLPKGQVARIVYPDLSEEIFEYEEKTGLEYKRTYRDKAAVEYVYSHLEGSAHSVVVAKAHYKKVSDAKPLAVKRYVYEQSAKNDVPLLRYEISPEGRVKEYNYTSEGLLESYHTYPDLKDLYPLSDRIPTLIEMEKWKSEESRASRRTAARFFYDTNGRLKQAFDCVEQDEKSIGIESKNSPEKKYGYDELGRCNYLSIKQSMEDKADQYLQSTFDYNDTGSLLKKVIGAESKLSQVTKQEYKENIVTTRHPNNRVEIKEFDSRDLLKQISDRVADYKEDKKYDYKRDENGRINIETLPDGNKVVSFYDKQNQLNFTIDQDGAVTQIDSNRQFRYKKKTAYSIKVDVAGLASAEDLKDLWVDDEHHRDSYEFFGTNDKVRFEIDAENYLIEYQYDSLGNVSKQINYSGKVSADELEKLKQGVELARKPSRESDQITSYFYDRDGMKIAEQNPLGYVTQFKRDGAGRIINKINYDTRCLKIAENVEDILPAETPEKDAHHYYFYNLLNQCVLEVNAEGYITTHTYNPDGQKQSSIQYEAPADNWLIKDNPPVPIASKNGNDQTTQYIYDALGRKIEVIKSNGKTDRYTYDEMSRPKEVISEDARNIAAAKSIDGDAYRASEFKYDGWGQVIAKADPLVKAHLKKLALHSPVGQDKNEESDDKWIHNQYNEVGLKTKAIDQLGHVVLHYYNKKGLPVLSIDATGAIIENSYNAFGDIIEERHYYNRIPSSALQNLTGGYLTSDIEKLLIKDPSKDAVTKFIRDGRGQVVQKTDPELNVSLFSYNAFRKCDHEILPAANNNTFLEVIHTYDACNNETKVETIAITNLAVSHIDTATKENYLQAKKLGTNNNIEEKISPTEKRESHIVEKKYEHFLGKVTEVKNELGARVKQELDKLGRIKKIDKEVTRDNFITDVQMEYDAFNQITKTVNAEGNATLIEYNQEARTRTFVSLADASRIIVKENAFGETIIHTDGEGNEEFIRHGADGQVTERRQGEDVTSTEYNVKGLKEAEIDAENVKTKYLYNNADALTQRIEDAGEQGLNLTWNYKPNAFGYNEVEIDARNVTSHNTFNRCGYLVKKIRDVEGKALITQYVRNARGDESFRVMGDANVLDQHSVSTEYDSFSRMALKVIDPNYVNRPATHPVALEIKTEFKHDDVGNVTKETDPNGQSTYHIYNLSNDKIFTIKPLDKNKVILTEWDYSKTKKVTGVRAYSTPIDAKIVPDLIACNTREHVKNFVKLDDKNDAVNQYYYDEKNREIFSVTVVWNAAQKKYQSLVVEKQYDKADRMVKKISYYNPLETKEFPSWKPSDFNRRLIKNEVKDNIINYWHDKKSRVRFTVDQYGAVEEKRYDAVGREIAKISYFAPCENWQNKTLEELIKEVQEKANPLRDRASYKVYDRVGREIFIVKPDGAVFRKDYDANKNVTRVCLFKNPIQHYENYQNLVAALKARIPDRKKDTIIDKQYDNLDFVTKVTDALGHEDIFDKTVLGLAQTHTDRSHHVWQFKFDRANRLIEEITPKTKIAVPFRGKDGKLAFSEIETTISKKTDFDPAGNTRSITDGIIDKNLAEEKLIQPRRFNLAFNAQHQISTTLLPEALVDDEAKPASLQTLPEKLTTLKTESVWNARGKQLVEINPAGLAFFNVFDSANRLIFSIDRERAVTEYRYNSYDQPTEVIQYATKLPDLSAFNKEGLTPDILLNDIEIKRSPDDRIKELSYDRSARLVGVKTGPVIYYSDGKVGLAQPETKKEFNVLSDCTVEYRLTSPGVWSKKLTWYDKCDRPIAEVDESNYLTLYERNTAGKIIKRKEFAKALPSSPTISTYVEELSILVEESSSDRVYQYGYDLLGQKISETICNVATESLALDEKTSVPSLKVKENQNLTRRWEFSPTEKETCFTHEDGSKEHKYYDERDLKVAETKVSRTSANVTRTAPIIVTPLTLSLPNAFGQVAVTKSSNKGGTLPDDKGTVPTLILSSTPPETPAQLIQTITLHDNQGLVKFKENAENHITGFTNTPTRKIARKLNEVSVWEKPVAIHDEKEIKDSPRGIPTFVKEKHIDESRFKYDGCNRTIQSSKLRDNKVERESFSRFNSFGEFTAECADGKSWNSFKKTDTQGNPWFTLDKHGGMMKLFDLSGAETLALQSTDKDLNLINYDLAAFTNLLATNSKSLERTETIRDAAGHAAARRFPIWFKDKGPRPTRSYLYDRWLNITKETNSLGHETDYEYNHRDQLRKRIQPEVTVVGAQGNKIVVDEKGHFPRKRPQTFYGHNERGFKVGTTNANNHTHGVLLDEAGQQIARVLGDGVMTDYQILNASEVVTNVFDSLNHQWKYTYDRVNNLILEYWPAKNFDRGYGYDEVGRRNLDWDLIGRSIRYNYDACDNITERYLPLGQCTQTKWDHNNLELQVTNPDGDTMSWARTYFGAPTLHTDLAKRVTGYENNFKNELKRQFTVTHKAWADIQVDKGVLFPPNDTRHEYPAVTFMPRVFSSAPQNVTYNRAYGLLESIVDTGLGKSSTYQYDTEGRPYQLEVKDTHNTLLYRIKTTYDELSRDALISDERLSDKMLYSSMTTKMLYDAASNRRNVDVTTTAAGYAAGCNVVRRKDSWNLYDAADRVVLINGVVDKNRCVSLAPFLGLQLDYYKDFRVKEVRVGAEGRVITADIVYDYNSLLQRTLANGPTPIVTKCSYNNIGLFDTYIEEFNGKSITKNAHFDENNWQVEEMMTDSSYPGGLVSKLTVTEVYQGGYPRTEKFQDLKNKFTDVRVSSYFATDSADLSVVSATRTNEHGTSGVATAQFLHDANKRVSGKIDSGDEIQGTAPAAVCIDTTPEGWLMNKQAVLYRANVQTNYFHNIRGELLSGYATGYFDISSSAERPVMLKGLFGTDQDAPSFVEGHLKRLPFSNGIFIGTIGVSTGKIVFFLNKKIVRHPDGRPVIVTSQIPKEEINALPTDVIQPYILKVRREAVPWLFDKVMDSALKCIGSSQAYCIQNSHFALHHGQGGYEVKPDVGELNHYSPIYPIARVAPSDPHAKNGPLNWDESQRMSKLGLQTYIVTPGDTFKSIAKKLGGDNQDAYKIARLNGFINHRHVPKPGLILRIPQFIASKNNAKTVRPDQDFMRVIMGSLSPILNTPGPTQSSTVPRPVKRKKKKHGFWGSFIKIIAVALVCVAAPHLAGFLFPLLASGSTAFAVATATIAAIGDAAVQGLAIKMGAQDKFSFTEIIETAMTAGVATTLGVANGSAGILAMNALKIGAAAVSTQLAEMAAGLRDRFDANAIVTQVTASIVAAKINDGIDGLFGERTSLAYATKQIATPFSNAVLGGAITHTPVDIQNLAMNAMGSTIGNNLGDRVGDFFNQNKSLGPLNVPSTDIDVNDPKRSSDLSDLASRQWEERLSQVESKSSSHSYLLDSDRRAKYSHMLFGGGVTRAQTKIKASTPSAKAPKVSHFGSIVEKEAEFNLRVTKDGAVAALNEINPVVTIPRDAEQAYSAFASNDIRGGLTASAGVALGVWSCVPIGMGERMAVGGVAYLAGKARLFGRVEAAGAESVANIGEKTARFTELASGSKAEVRALLKSGELNLPLEQVDKLLYTLGSGRMDKVTLKLMNSGDVRLAAERAGRIDGYQRMSFEINQQGRTNRVVQTAFDDTNKLVPQRPGESKNNLYDVKKWNRQTY
jgi:YD repeat-containing protein